MKKFRISIALSACLMFLFSCSNQTETGVVVKESLYQKIATDQSYIDYKRADEEHLVRFATVDVDYEALQQYINNYKNQSKNLCSTPNEMFKNVRGGVAYIESFCKIRELHITFLEKNPLYKGLNLEEKNKIDVLYKQLNPNTDVTNRILQSIGKNI